MHREELMEKSQACKGPTDIQEIHADNITALTALTQDMLGGDCVTADALKRYVKGLKRVKKNTRRCISQELGNGFIDQ
jgi:hypothetical protein